MQKKEILSYSGLGPEVAPLVSRKIIQHLVDQGITVTQIAKWIGSSKSFVSRVKSGQKALTIARLVRLEEGLKRPLPLLYMEVVETESMSKELRDKYKSLREAWKELAETE